MKKTFLFLAAAIVIGAVIYLWQYAGESPSGQEAFVPQAPDYADPTMWITADGDSLGNGADVFYVVSTWEEDYDTIITRESATPDTLKCHYADVWRPGHRERMAREINRVAAYMSPGNRFYSPYYRHATIETFMTNSDDSIRQRTRLSMSDVCAAFDCFQAQRDQSRPLIIAGFSQGGLAVVELLKHISDETYSQMAAAYVLGYKVTPEDTFQTTHIKAAPTLHDSITVTLSPEHHVLVVSGYSGSEYRPYKNFLNVGDIHSCEPWLYSDCLQRNINVRAKEWYKNLSI